MEEIDKLITDEMIESVCEELVYDDRFESESAVAKRICQIVARHLTASAKTSRSFSRSGLMGLCRPWAIDKSAALSSQHEYKYLDRLGRTACKRWGCILGYRSLSA